MRVQAMFATVLLSVSGWNAALAADTPGRYWSSADFQLVLQRTSGAGQEWGQTSLRLAEVSLSARMEGADYAYELKSLECFATKLKDLNDGLMTIEVLCASITEPERRRYAILILADYYESIARSVINGAEQVFQASASMSAYPDIRAIGSTLFESALRYDQYVATPRMAELDSLKSALGADPEKDGHGP